MKHWLIFILLSTVTLLPCLDGSAAEIDATANFDDLDPRFPNHNNSILQRLFISGGRSAQSNPADLDSTMFSPFDLKLLSYIREDRSPKIKFSIEDLDFSL